MHTSLPRLVAHLSLDSKDLKFNHGSVKMLMSSSGEGEALLIHRLKLCTIEGDRLISNRL
jgi:hypothetical protein